VTFPNLVNNFVLHTHASVSKRVYIYIHTQYIENLHVYVCLFFVSVENNLAAEIKKRFEVEDQLLFVNEEYRKLLSESSETLKLSPRYQTESSIREIQSASTQTVHLASTNTTAQTVSSVFGTMGIQIDSTVNKTARIQNDLSRQRTPSASMQINVVTDDDVGTDLTIVGTSANVNPDESFSAVQLNTVPCKTVDIQTELEPTIVDILSTFLTTNDAFMFVYTILFHT